MSEFFGSVWWLMVTLGVLVTFHEFGHFGVARRFGVKVLRFSIGFGKPLWSRLGRDGVEFVIGAIPLGGYVKFSTSAKADRPRTRRRSARRIQRASPWQRMAISLAGPAFNIVFTDRRVLGDVRHRQARFAAGDRRAAGSRRGSRSCTKAIASSRSAAKRPIRGARCCSRSAKRRCCITTRRSTVSDAQGQSVASTRSS